jgi:predicted small secreted protein
MKKLFLALAIVIFVVFTFSACSSSARGGKSGCPMQRNLMY